MEPLIVFYLLILIIILFYPFISIRREWSTGFSQKSNLSSGIEQKRSLLLDNLKDLKLEKDTGKINTEELAELSQPIVSQLQKIDRQYPEITPKNETTCSSCQYQVKISQAKFCPMCGNELS